ncbi:hypothetical protein HanIR_Chr04g0178671 [Helianthus annuus]|nr:hypothetical protein HanIR_Chr04g0178671 [Helianthus annuus]
MVLVMMKTDGWWCSKAAVIFSRSHAPGERRRLWWLGSALAWPVNRRSGLKRVRIVARINSVLVRA